MSTREISHLVISTVVLAISFGIAFSGGAAAFNDVNTLLIDIRVSLVVIVLGFALHELAHRFMARRYGLSAEYYMSPLGLGIALVASLTGWIFAAPGAVRIYGNLAATATPEEYQEKLGKISLAGPLTNICIAVLFLLAAFTAGFLGILPEGDSVAWKIMVFGVEINTWLAVFNLLPVWDLDGRDIFKWNKPIWIAAMLVSAGLYVYIIL